MSGKKTKSAVKTTAAVKNPATAAGFCVYIGPTITGVIQNGTIMRGGKKEVLKSFAPAIEKYPLITSLIVTGDTLAQDRIKAMTPGNLLYVNYRKLAGNM